MGALTEAMNGLRYWVNDETWKTDSETIAQVATDIETVTSEASRMWRVEARQSDDDVKRDLELTCVDCEQVLCDIEHGDVMGVLINMVEDHNCPGAPDGR